MPKDVIIALDFGSKEETLEFLDRFDGGRKPFVKIGMELYYACGPEIVREIKSRGHRIFLDLKMHDIPNTVRGGMRSVAELGVDMTNVHAAGGVKMMEEGLAGLEEGCAGRGLEKPLLIAVTQLTSISGEILKNELLIDRDLNDVILGYAENVKAAGLSGVVCSPLEAGMIHEKLGDGFLTVTPGIRFADDEKADQNRITTPAKARELGSDYIVVGRSVTKAADPVAAYERCVRDFLGEE